MRFLKWMFITIVILLAIFFAGGFLLPSQVHVERSTVIQAEASEIFPYVNNFRRFNEWSPWAARDPDTEYSFAGPDAGVGAKMTWRSDHEEVGSGTQEIIESEPNRRVVSALDFGEMGTAKARFRLEPQGSGTKVTWMLDSELPPGPAARWIGLALDGLVGAEYEEGLARLKRKVESGEV